MSSFQEIDIQQFRELTANNAALTVIDNRDAESFNKQHVPNAINIPLSQLPEESCRIDKLNTIVCYCYHGKSSQLAAQMLAEHGFEPVYSLIGGFGAWSAAEGA